MYRQNSEPGSGAAEDDTVTLGWDADATFVIETQEETT